MSSTEEQDRQKIVAKHLPGLVRRELLRVAAQARQDVSRKYGGGGFAARKAERFYRRFLQVSFVLLFVVPLLATSVYFISIASDQYSTESYIRLSSESSDVRAALSGLLGSNVSEQGSSVVEYLQSPNIIRDVSKVVNIGEMYTRDQIDYFSRLRPNSAIEDVAKFWKRKISVNTQSFTSQIRVRIRAFSPEDSLRLHQELLNAAERHVNEISRGQQTVRIAEATQGVGRAQEIYKNAIDALQSAREEYGVLDAESVAKGYQTIIAKLRTDEATLSRRIETIKKQAPESPQLRRLTPQLAVVQQQIHEYERLIADSDDTQGQTVAVTAADLDARNLDVEIAREELVARMAILEAEKAEAAKQTIFIQRVVNPVLPERPTHPRRWLAVGISAGLLFCAWLVVAWLGLLVRDNME